MEQLRPVQTSCNVSFPCSREYLTGGYTFYEFVTARHTCAITTALHSLTSINRRFSAASKVESLSLLNPHYEPLLTWASECLQVHTPPMFQNSTNVFPPSSTIAFKKRRQPPSDQVRSMAPSVENIKLSPFFTYKKPKLSYKKPWLPTVLLYASRAKSNALTSIDKRPPLLLHLAHGEEPHQRVLIQRFWRRNNHHLVLHNLVRWLTILL